MNPQELLRKIARYVGNGMPAAEADRFVAQESGYQYQSVKELSDAIGARQHAQNLADSPPSMGEKVSQFVGGLAQNALQGLTLNHADEMAGGMNAILQHLPQGAESYPGENKYNRENAYAIGKRNSQGIGDRMLGQGFLGNLAGGTAQTAGALGGMAATGVLSAPAAAAKYLPGLLKTLGVAGGLGLVAGEGAAPTVKDIPAYAGAGATNAELLAGTLGATIPAASWVVGKGSDLFNMLRGNPAAMRQLANRQVGASLNADQADGGGLPLLDEMRATQLTGVVPADAGSTSSSLLRQSANREPSVRLPVKQLVRDRQAQVGPDMANALERTRGMTQTEARAGEAQALAAKRATGKAFDAIDAVPLPENSPAAQVIGDMRSWSQPPKVMSPEELMVRRQNFKMGMGPNPDEPGPTRPYGAPRIGRLVDRTLRNVGDQPLSVQHGRAILNALKDAKQGILRGPARDRSLFPVINDQIDRLQAALEQSSPEFQAANDAYRQQAVASEAFTAGRATRNAPDPIQAMAERNAAIKAGAPETRLRMAQGSTADWTDMLRASDPRAPGAPFNELANVASPRREAAGQLDPRRALFRSDFPSQKALNRMDRAVALEDRMRQTEGDIAGNSTTAAQGSDMGAGTSFQVLRDMVRGGTLKWGVARSFADLLDAIRRPQTRAMARMVAEDLMAPYSDATRQRLYGLMQLEEQAAQQQGLLRGAQLQRAGVTGGLLGARQ